MKKAVICVLSLLAVQLVCSPVCNANELQDILEQVGSLPLPEFIGSLESFVEKHPTNAMARFELAKSYMKMKQGELAEEQLRTCMTLAPAGTELHNGCIAQLKELSLDKVNRLPNTVPGTERSVAPMTGVTGSYKSSYGGIRYLPTILTAPPTVKSIPSSSIANSSKITSTKASASSASANKMQVSSSQALKQSKNSSAVESAKSH